MHQSTLLYSAARHRNLLVQISAFLRLMLIRLLFGRQGLLVRHLVKLQAAVATARGGCRRGGVAARVAAPARGEELAELEAREGVRFRVEHDPIEGEDVVRAEEE